MKIYKKYAIGQEYVLKYSVQDETGNTIPAGIKIRIVSIVPKVRITKGINKDSLPYFYNAVLSNQESDYGNRIRENFCTLF